MALTDKLSAIGDAIREKTGGTDKMALDDMPTEIASITTGGGEIPEEAFMITGECEYRFAENNWNWFIEKYGEQLTTNRITNLTYAFYNSSSLSNIPFEINGTNTDYTEMSSMFQKCTKLVELPKINKAYPLSLSSWCRDCSNLREIPEDYCDSWYWINTHSSTFSYRVPQDFIFANCYSLRSFPDSLFAQNHINRYLSSYSTVYYNGFNRCMAIEKVKLPVYDLVSWTSNSFKDTFSYTSRLTSVTFNTNEDDSPIVCDNWNNQTINLAGYNGYAASSTINLITGYNSGITADKQVTDDASYQALKDDPDWFTTDKAYSRYNHDSAVETINTLPDVSSGSGNTIKFVSEAGSATDGGAINTLTDEEIAVATAKGWTVTLV